MLGRWWQAALFEDLGKETGMRLIVGIAALGVVVLAGSGPAQTAAENCVTFANNQGGSDNISAAIVAIGDEMISPPRTGKHEPLPSQVRWEALYSDSGTRPKKPRRRFRGWNWIIIGLCLTLIIIMVILLVQR